METDRQAGFLRCGPEWLHGRGGIVDRLAGLVLPGRLRNHEGLQPEGLDLLDRGACFRGVPPVRNRDAVEAIAGLFAQLGEVLVVDAENQVPDFEVTMMEETLDPLRKGDLH